MYQPTFAGEVFGFAACVFLAALEMGSSDSEASVESLSHTFSVTAKKSKEYPHKEQTTQETKLII